MLQPDLQINNKSEPATKHNLPKAKVLVERLRRLCAAEHKTKVKMHKAGTAQIAVLPLTKHPGDDTWFIEWLNNIADTVRPT